MTDVKDKFDGVAELMDQLGLTSEERKDLFASGQAEVVWETIAAKLPEPDIEARCTLVSGLFLDQASRFGPNSISGFAGWLRTSITDLGNQSPLSFLHGNNGNVKNLGRLYQAYRL